MLNNILKLAVNMSKKGNMYFAAIWKGSSETFSYKLSLNLTQKKTDIIYVHCHYLNQLNVFMSLKLIKHCYTYPMFMVIQFGTHSMG